MLLVGGVFGAGGYAAQVALAPGLGDYVDVVALVVFLSGLLARLMFGKTGPFGAPAERGKRRFTSLRGASTYGSSTSRTGCKPARSAWAPVC